MMHWMLMPLKRYTDFSGRSRRKEFWLFQLGLFLTLVVVANLTKLFVGHDPFIDVQANTSLTALIGIVTIVILIPSLAVQIRRLHDQDRTGWWVLIGVIPYLGWFILFVLMCQEGTGGPNRFGPDPKDNNLADVFA